MSSSQTDRRGSPKRKTTLDEVNSRLSRNSSAIVDRAEELVFSYLGVTPSQVGSENLPHMSDMTVDEVAIYHLSSQIASKYEGRRLPGIDPLTSAWTTFRDCEETCGRINREFSEFIRTAECGVRSVLHRVREKIRMILGPIPDLSDVFVDHGKGSTATVRVDCSAYKKNHAVPSGTIEALRHSQCNPVIDALIAEHGGRVEVVHGSVMTFVPKTCKTHRPIAIEPTINSMMQRALGKEMKVRLQKAGCNLRDQTINRQVSARAVRDGLATIDFSSASDTIAYEVVRYLLPWEWFEVLSTYRCESYLYEGRWRSYAKFSSMGNGYTFELESLIFFALAKAICGNDVEISVYGDDVIIPTTFVPQFSHVAGLLGFTVNRGKSFSTGLFRESCGLDTWDGWDVTPFRIKKKIETVPDVYRVLNKITRWIKTHPSLERQTLGKILYDHFESTLPRQFLLYGPDGLGDNWIVASDFPVVRSFSKDLQRSVRRVRGIALVPVNRFPRACNMFHALYELEKKPKFVVQRRYQNGRVLYTSDVEDTLCFADGYPLRGRMRCKPKSFRLD